ncbi:hypothetical protein M514_02884 [Trichuris suis]|uniref:Uncharacterized protein n=1 Tax=Trichuris suis TaxID=68888 RepID=A0A085MFW0_9BILA|nr:hypothetical protein M513_02884 [Trichuris suis]KFD66633.1 hypothetical protein M514_02884 [Trichuris suis]
MIDENSRAGLQRSCLLWLAGKLEDTCLTDFLNAYLEELFKISTFPSYFEQEAKAGAVIYFSRLSGLNMKFVD